MGMKGLLISAILRASNLTCIAFLSHVELRNIYMNNKHKRYNNQESIELYVEHR